MSSPFPNGGNFAKDASVVPTCKFNQCGGTGIIDVMGYTPWKAICACKIEELEYRISHARPDVPPGTGMVIGGLR